MLPTNLCSCSKTAPACVAGKPEEKYRGMDLSSWFRFFADNKASFISLESSLCSSDQVIFRFLALSELLKKIYKFFLIIAHHF